ncbi:efflux RND transporter periplasmic adaptor subunit [Sinimarinibacterium flocculans]|uniref:Multidrug resistance efflux pump n=1 Tax=Sinimarinibacterium flocculans TaxID=985250 RepID=A0A318EF48_9GAMM|nr:efflux RND transporter periplasmic adaptor subunit [Sinimarinibacterium flocculans]PXV70294.1 multidrug resistance efflux pump [Sinimarinibacterium flocculans]
MIDSRYRRFAPARVVEHADGGAEVHAADGGFVLRLSAAEYAAAQLFDGRRSAAARLEAAADAGWTAATIEGLAAELAVYRLLQAGTHEPLPPPAHNDAERIGLGWTGLEPVLAAAPPASLPPSSVPGSRVSPGLTGGLTGLVTGRRGQANQIDWPLPPTPFVILGRLLIWPLRSRLHLGAFIALCGLAIALVITHRYGWLLMSAGLFGSYRAIATALVGAALINLLSMSARAAAVARYTPSTPRIGLVRGALGIPHLFVDTAGAAERAGRVERLRIVGSGLVGSAAAASIAVLTWFLFVDSQVSIARFCVGLTVVTTISLVLRLNPLMHYDGHFLLCHLLDTPDLREQAIGALLGARSRPWLVRTRRVSYRALLAYGFAAAVFLLVLLWLILWGVGGWLAERYHGVGFLVLLSVMGVYMVRQYSRAAVDRTTMGHVKRPWRPTRRQKITALIVAIVCVLPYPYSASGEFEILPRDRADVRALVAGDVREVLVTEGDAVAAGQVIARLDDSAQRARVAVSEAELARLEAELAIVRMGAREEEIELARSKVETAKAAAELAERSAARVAVAFRGKSVTPQEYERAQGAAEVARQQLLEAQRALALIESPALAERIQSIEAEKRRIQAELEYARQELAYTRIKVPIAGRIVSSELQFARGHYLNRGDPLAVVEDTATLYADIRIPESSIGETAIDADASLKPWAFPHTSFDGRVRAIAPAADDDTYGKIIRVQVELQDPDGRLRTGMTGNAKVDAGWSLTGIVFTRAIARFVFVELWSWIP